MYTADLEEKVDDHGVNYHAYADDRKLYLRCRSEDTSTVVDTLENCVTDISQEIGSQFDFERPLRRTPSCFDIVYECLEVSTFERYYQRYYHLLTSLLFYY